MSFAKTVSQIGFVVLTAAALSACGKSVSDQPVDVFEISLPDRGSPQLRNLEELSTGNYLLRRFGFSVEAGSERADWRQDLVHMGTVSAAIDRIEVRSNSVNSELGFAFKFNEDVKFFPNAFVAGDVAFSGVVAPDQSFSLQIEKSDFSKIEEVLTDLSLSSLGYPDSRGVYTRSGDAITFYVIETESGFSLYFRGYESISGSRSASVTGRIDYIKE